MSRAVREAAHTTSKQFRPSRPHSLSDGRQACQRGAADEMGGRGAQGEEWEERWEEDYWSMGRAKKWADKWARAGTNVWHERWGEDYDGGGGCVKYTDKARPPA